MAFLSNITSPQLREYTNAYISARVIYCDKNKTLIHLQVWESQELKELHATIPVFTTDLELPTVMWVASNNPIDYAYKLLEASDNFPNATWNI